MTDLRAAAEAALEALVEADPLGRSGTIEKLRAALAEPEVEQELRDWEAVAADQAMTIAMLRAQLAEPEAEPVAWMDREGDIYPMPEKPGWAPPHTLLYAAPPRPAPAEPDADWSLFKATQESLREHMAEIHRLRAALAEPTSKDALPDQLRAAAEAALEALINGKNVRAGEGGTKHQPTMEDVAIEQLRAALAESVHADDTSAGHVKNPAGNEQVAEPVAWLSWTDGEGYGYWETKAEAELNCSGDAEPVPLYTYPPRREWVGLTDEERFDAFDDYLAQTSDGRHWFRHWWSYAGEEREAFDAGVAAAEAALKEKNT